MAEELVEAPSPPVEQASRESPSPKRTCKHPDCLQGIDTTGEWEFLPQCLGCRREVEASMSRAARGKMRSLRSAAGCSPKECVKFLEKIKTADLRHHLACMAWWHMSTFTDSEGIKGILAVMQSNRAPVREFGTEYMHRAITALSPLKPAQLAAWFGFDNLYQAVSLYMGEKLDDRGVHCQNCLLLKQGCTDYDKKGVENCRLWQDKFIQAVVEVVNKDKKWNNPCSKIPKELKVGKEKV